MKHLEIIIKKLELAQEKTTELIKDADIQIQNINKNRDKYSHGNN